MGVFGKQKNLFHPIINFEMWNPIESLYFVRDQNAVDRKDIGGD
jgi:hypothetical protein